jgi:hypothetical protein
MWCSRRDCGSPACGTARTLVPLGHSQLIVSGAVGRLVEHFMRSGVFE